MIFNFTDFIFIYTFIEFLLMDKKYWEKQKNVNFQYLKGKVKNIYILKLRFLKVDFVFTIFFFPS